MISPRFHEFLNLFQRLVPKCFINHVKNVSTSPSGKVRVRFAPSPTGHLHLGGLRTALYNYLFARSRGGAFVLRLEDTDQSRLVPGAAEGLERDLAWVGIPPDESPARGGPYGPYTQSQRLPIYREHAERLLQSGAAYHCFCSERRLDLLRREALRARQVPRYDNRCRHLSQQQVDEKLARGEQFCIRFKLVPSPEPFQDLVYGPVMYDVGRTEGDPVVLKGDGYPTYHLASVVDDRLMQVSHVLRGVEWQVSTPKHLLIYRALGWKPPQFGHLPLILNPDGTKLSKRQGDVSVGGLRERGIFPLALLNYVTLTGGGFTRDLYRTRPCIYSLPELASVFDVGRLNAHSCRLQPDQLLEFNRLELQRRLSSGDDAELVQQVRQLVATKFAHSGMQLRLEDEHVLAVLRWGQARVHTLSDLVEPHLAFLWVMPTTSIDLPPAHRDVLERVCAEVAGMPDTQFEKEWLKPWLQRVADDSGVQFRELMKLLRAVLSGLQLCCEGGWNIPPCPSPWVWHGESVRGKVMLQEGPGVAEMMHILGRSETASRLDRALSALKTHSQ